MNSQFQLLKEKRFGPLFWTQFLGAFNDNVLKNSLIIYISFKSISVLSIPPEQIVAVAGGIFILPFFLFSALAGQLADQFDKKTVIKWVKITEIAIMISAFIGYWFQHYEFLLFSLFAMGAHSAFFGPVKYSILPQHLKQHELTQGNALVEAGTFLGILLGTIFGGIFVLINEQGPTIVSCVMLVLSIAGYAFCLKIPEAPPLGSKVTGLWNPFKVNGLILKTLFKNQTALGAVWGISWFWFTGAGYLSLFPSYAKNVLHSNQNVVTLFLSCFSIGIAVGSLFCSHLSKTLSKQILVRVGIWGMTAFIGELFFVGTPSGLDLNSELLGILGFLSNTWGLRILFDLVGFSVFAGIYIVPLYTLLQESADEGMRSKIIAGNNIFNALFMVILSIILVLLMRLNFNIPEIFLSLAFANGLVGILYGKPKKSIL